ncbi:MAG: hypothetical protein JXR63_07160 [Spirochaetales bacterium]|nr:hypothetical protein [Spirochaetales bacterium]
MSYEWGIDGFFFPSDEGKRSELAARLVAKYSSNYHDAQLLLCPWGDWNETGRHLGMVFASCLESIKASGKLIIVGESFFDSDDTVIIEEEAALQIERLGGLLPQQKITRMEAPFRENPAFDILGKFAQALVPCEIIRLAITRNSSDLAWVAALSRRHGVPVIIALNHGEFAPPEEVEPCQEKFVAGLAASREEGIIPAVRSLCYGKQFKLLHQSYSTPSDDKVMGYVSGVWV